MTGQLGHAEFVGSSGASRWLCIAAVRGESWPRAQARLGGQMVLVDLMVLFFLLLLYTFRALSWKHSWVSLQL